MATPFLERAQRVTFKTVPVYIAMSKGFFKKEGLDAEYVSMGGKALVTAGISGNGFRCEIL